MIKSKSFLYTSLIVLTLILGLTLNSSQASAQSGQALEIAPPVLVLSGDPGQTITAEINLRDISSSKLVVTNEINDFTASDKEDGTPNIILDDGETNPFSIKSWINPISKLTLDPKQIKKVPVIIKIPANAPPGGYYGVVRFTGNPPELEGTGVSLSASLGALILLRVNGEVVEKLNIEEFGTSSALGGSSKSLFEMAPIYFYERIKNTGSIHERPAGQITITDMFNNKVAVVNVNIPPRDILPSSIRKFEQTLDSETIGTKMLFGKYTANLKIAYGTSGETLEKTITFWVIPYTLIAIGIIGLVGGFLLLRFVIRRYNNHIIAQADKRRAKSRK